MFYTRRSTHKQMLHILRWTSAVCLQGLGVDLEVEDVRYIEMYREPAAHVLGPPPSRGVDLKLEGEVNVSL